VTQKRREQSRRFFASAADGDRQRQRLANPQPLSVSVRAFQNKMISAGGGSFFNMPPTFLSGAS
jgi:hypothetical protein